VGVICIQPGTIEFRTEVSAPVDEAIRTVSDVLLTLMRGNNP